MREKVKNKKQKRKRANNKINLKSKKGITLIALVITILFSYDERIKCSDSKGFLPTTI